MIIGVLRWGWVEVILRVNLEVILHNLLRQKSNILSFLPPSETGDSHHPYTGEMGVPPAPACPDSAQDSVPQIGDT